MTDTTPTPKPAANDVLIGTCTFGQSAGKALRLDSNDLAKHLLAIGSTGSGKTVLLKAVAESLLVKEIPVVCIDVLGDLLGLAIPADGESAYTDLGLPLPPKLAPEDWEMGGKVAKAMRRVIHARYLTPCSDVGERLSISPLPSRNGAYKELMASARDDLELQASTAAWALMGRIGLKQPRDGVGGADELVRGMLTSSILEAWERGIDLEGEAGVRNFQDLVVEVVGGRMPTKQLQQFLVGMSSMCEGQAARWLEGMRLDWDSLLSAPKGKTPLVVIGIDHLPREHHPWVVSQVVNSLAGWCAAQAPAPGRLRCSLFIDELKGEGGKLSLLPPLTFASPSGHAIRRVLRQGRHWSLGFLGGTQSPRDVDSRNFSQFNSRFIGKLTNSYDVRVSLEGATMSEERAKKVGDYIKGASAPRMFYVRPEGSFESVRVRWLGTLHSRVPLERIPSLYAKGILWRDPASISARSAWARRDDTLHDGAGRVVVGVGADAVSIAAATGDGVVRTAALASPSELTTLAAWLGGLAAHSGIRCCAYRSSDAKGGWGSASQALGMLIPGGTTPWYELGATLARSLGRQVAPPDLQAACAAAGRQVPNASAGQTALAVIGLADALVAQGRTPGMASSQTQEHDDQGEEDPDRGESAPSEEDDQHTSPPPESPPTVVGEDEPEGILVGPQNAAEELFG